MTQATQLTGFVCRIYLAVFFASHAIHAAFPAHPGIWPAVITPHGPTGFRWQEIAVAGLLAVVALWLVLGIRSRIVALIGMVICTATVLLHPEPLTGTDPAHLWSLPRLAALAAVAVLAVTGGGRWRLHAGGWKFRNCL